MSALHFTNKAKDGEKRDPPKGLADVAQWIVWRYVAGDGDKLHKMPSTPDGHNLKGWQKDSNQWLEYNDALDALKADRAGDEILSGLGFVLTKDAGIIGVDMDGCIDAETGEIADWAQAHLDDFKDTYAEISPSGTGLRMFALGNLPDGCRKHSGHREIYDSGRWLTLTGNSLNAEPVTTQTEAVERYLAAMRPDGEKTPQAAAQDARQGDIVEGERNSKLTSLAGYMRRGAMSPDEVEAALHAANEARCKPPLPDEEVSGIARSVCRYAPSMDAAQTVDFTGGLERVACGDLSAAILPPVDCVMHPYFPRRQVTLFGGHGGSGKSYLALAFAAHLATGEQWAGHECQQGRVLYVSLEDEQALNEWRLARVCDAYFLDSHTVAAGVDFMDGTATAATLAIETGQGKQLEETAAWGDLREQAQGFDTIIIDNASDAFTANVNDPVLVRVFLRKLQTLARETDAACILLAHIDKAGAKHGASGNSYIGTAAWHNTVRSRIALVNDKGGLTLAHEKHNLTTGAETLHLRKTEDGVPTPTSRVRIRESENAAAALQAERDAPGILKLLNKATERGQSVSNTRSGNYTAWNVLKNFGLPKDYHGKEGKQRFWRAVDQLYQGGQITNEDYRDDRRKPKTRIAVLEHSDEIDKIEDICAASNA